MGKVHKIKRQFKKADFSKKGFIRVAGLHIRVLKRYDGSMFLSNWSNGYHKLIAKLEREYLGPVGRTD